MSDNTIALIIIFIWLILVTVFLVGISLAWWMNKIDFGPTGPTGPAFGPPGPTGPTGPSSSTTLTSNLITSTFTPNFNGNIGCFPCNFYNINGQVSDHQSIPPDKPTIVRWVLNSNLSSESGTFTLPSGTYVVSTSSASTSVVYPSMTSSGFPNTGGNYRSMSIWLRDANINNVVSENELIGTVTAVAIPNSPTTLTFPTSVQFTVNSIRNRFSIITWHNANQILEIGGLSRFNLVKIA